MTGAKADGRLSTSVPVHVLDADGARAGRDALDEGLAAIAWAEDHLRARIADVSSRRSLIRDLGKPISLWSRIGGSSSITIRRQGLRDVEIAFEPRRAVSRIIEPASARVTVAAACARSALDAPATDGETLAEMEILAAIDARLRLTRDEGPRHLRVEAATPWSQPSAPIGPGWPRRGRSLLTRSDRALMARPPCILATTGTISGMATPKSCRITLGPLWIARCENADPMSDIRLLSRLTTRRTRRTAESMDPPAKE